jgi:lipoprotein-anchoring transpeptidase ErfK/SrfK
MKRRFPAAVAAAVLTLAAVLVGCGGGGDATLGKSVKTTTTLPPATSATPVTNQSLIAQAVVPQLAVYDAPNASTPSRQLENPWVVSPDFPDQTVPQVFLVKEQNNQGWAKVLLPIRPNGTTGWVRTRDIRITPTNFRVRVELGAHRITIFQADAVTYQGPVAIGAPETPTPTGEYYVRVKIKAIDPTTVYGPYAWGLSSHSDVLETFNGGDGEIGIHGNNDASVLGSDVTHGCIRMDNDAITELTKVIRLGTPVDVVP